MKLDVDGDRITVEAQDLAPLLGLDPAVVQDAMRDGKLTSIYEKGVDADAGRFRVTFRYGATRVRLTCAADGRVVSHTRIKADAI